MRIYIYGLSNTPSKSGNNNSSSRLARHCAKLCSDCPYKYAIILHLPQVRDATPTRALRPYMISLSSYFFYIYIYNIYSTTSRAAGDVYDTCNFWATAANWQQKESVGRGRGKGIGRIRCNARQAAGKWQHYECGRHRATYRFMWHIYLLIRMQFIYIYAHNLHLTDFYEAPQSVAQPGTASLLQHQQQAKSENEEATDWSMNNKKKMNVQCFSTVQNRNR